ncbi:hypothetical protein MNBD_BACTEROID01-712 [hydrothermal vent metagenome]|uniref:PepSY-associated TM helix n=1 Tax=hydrothermal vent metagenome TaxID=652676 RepID=A0A3B0TN12_9ZZZZ
MRKFYKIIKDIHLHTGLFASPFIIIFSVSALVLNHNFVDWQEDWQEWYFSVNDTVDNTAGFNTPTPDKTDIDYAKGILKQINISGEIAGVFRDSAQMYIPVTKPGYRISIKADLISGIAYIHSEQTNLWRKLAWLHKMPGPHNANIRGNWVYTKIWRSLVDFSVICLFFSGITGVILWYYLKNERIIGLVALLIGFLSIASLIIGLTI